MGRNVKPGQRDDTTGRANFGLPTTTQGEGTLSYERYTRLETREQA